MLERTVDRWQQAVPVIIRVILGFTFLMYGYQKVFGWGLEGTTHFFRTQGFPLPGVFALVAEQLVDGLAAGHHHTAVSKQSSRVKFASNVQCARTGPGRADGIVDFRSRSRQKRSATCDQHFSI